MLEGARAAHPERDYTAVDPYTFGFLFRQAHGGSNTRRASFVDDTIPRVATADDAVQASVRVRNDGWETWGAGSCRIGVVVSVDPEATPAKAAPEARAEAVIAAPVPPGEAVDVPVSLTLPAGSGTFGLAYDVACGDAYFEDALAIPYRDTIVLGSK